MTIRSDAVVRALPFEGSESSRWDYYGEFIVTDLRTVGGQNPAATGGGKLLTGVRRGRWQQRAPTHAADPLPRTYSPSLHEWRPSGIMYVSM